MHKAYDTFLQSEVSADLAAKVGDSDPYRYECANCGEEVRLAAVDSDSMVPHFRHRSGNSNVECEYYLGQYRDYNTDGSSRKSKTERAEFYFDSNRKMFCLGLRFSSKEISYYEQNPASFELRGEAETKILYTLLINSSNFVADDQRMILLDKFSHDYFLSNTSSGIKRKYEVFNRTGNNVPTFFKVLTRNCDNLAKLVRSSILYTNVPYFVAFQNKYYTPTDINWPNDINIVSSLKFETMGRKFLGKVITITSKTAQIVSLLSKWGYELEASETLALLWPPSVFVNDTALISKDSAFLYSTFELLAHGNINVHSKDIIKIADGLSKVSVTFKAKVYKRNAELIIERYYPTQDCNSAINMFNKRVDKYVAIDDSTFLFNRSGVSLLSKGVTTYLTPGSEIRHYSSCYLDGLIMPLEHPKAKGEELLHDILIYYKRTEPFKWDDFEWQRLSDIAKQYIETLFFNAAHITFDI